MRAESVEAESALLGSLMIDATAFARVGDLVRPADFSRPDHREIFSAIAHRARAGKPCDALTVSQHLDSTGRLGEAGGLGYLSSLCERTPRSCAIEQSRGPLPALPMRSRDPLLTVAVERPMS
jgi:replicative DNA helicase